MTTIKTDDSADPLRVKADRGMQQPPAALVVAVAVVGGVTAALLMSHGDVDPMVVAAVVGLVAGLGCLAVAVARFDLFVLGLLALRPTLDGLSQGTQVSSAGMTSPSVVVGLAFVAASGIWIVTRAWRGQLAPPSPVAWGWLGLILAAAVSCVVSEYPVISLAATLRLTASALMFVILEQSLRTGVLSTSKILGAVLTVSVIVCGWTMLQAVTGGGAEDPWTGLTRVTGPFVHPSVLAKFLVVVSLLALCLLLQPRCPRVVRGWLLVGLLVSLTCLGLTYTRAAWLSCAVGVAMVLWWRKPVLLPVFGAAGVAAVLSVPSFYARLEDLWVSKPPAPGAPDTSFAWRVSFWEHLLPMAWRSPINGRGLDSISIIGGQDLPAHNIWVQAIVEMGVVGLITLTVLVAAIGAALRRALKRHPADPLPLAAAATGAALLLMSFSENLLNETTTLWYFAAVLAPALHAARHDEDPTSLSTREPS